MSLSLIINAQDSAESSVSTPPLEKKCSSVVEDLQFCTTAPVIKIKLGEKAILRLSMINKIVQKRSMESVWMLDGEMRRYPPYEITITDDKGKKYPTIEDELRQKYQDETITQEESDELFLRCCLNKGSRWGMSLPLAANQEYQFDWDLSPTYDFTAKGKYLIEVRRNVAVQNKKL